MRIKKFKFFFSSTFYYVIIYSNLSQSNKAKGKLIRKVVYFFFLGGGEDREDERNKFISVDGWLKFYRNNKCRFQEQKKKKVAQIVDVLSKS